MIRRQLIQLSAIAAAVFAFNAQAQDSVRIAWQTGADPAKVAQADAPPDILTGVRVGLGVGWSTLVAAQRGLGFMIQSVAQFLNAGIVVAGILVIAAVAFALESGLRRLQRRWVPWQGA